jgi:hypothetical protein
VRLFLAAAVTALAALVLATAASTAGSKPYRLLVAGDGIRVYVSWRLWGHPCPREALPLPHSLLLRARLAVLLAVPKLYAHQAGTPKLDVRDPLVRIGPAPNSGFSAAAGGCGDVVWNRSAVAFVRYPQVTFSASLSQNTFVVARLHLGWLIWMQIH